MNAWRMVVALGLATALVLTAQAQFNLGKVLNTAGDVVSAVKGVSSETATDLQSAYVDRLSAAARYKAFAAQAKTNNYVAVQTAFRAAEASATIQAKKIAALIQSSGATATGSAAAPVVKTTLENLQSATKSGTAVSRSTYPGFVKKATRKGDLSAARLFQQVISSETALVGIFSKASADLAAWKASGAEFAVCPTCGYAVETTRSLTTCPVCDAARSTFTSYK